jgi:hypothetical protein
MRDGTKESNSGAASASIYIEPLGLSIGKTAEVTSESAWTVKQRLRAGEYRAKKAGRRTIVEYGSVKEVWASLPDAKFMPPRQRKIKTRAK